MKQISNKAYDVGNYVAKIALPAIATFYAGLAALWSLPAGTEVVGTITLVDTLLGALLVIQKKQYDNQYGNDPAANQ